MGWTIPPHTSLRYAGYVPREPVRVWRSSSVVGPVLSVRVMLEGPQGSVSVSTSREAAEHGLGYAVLPDESLDVNAADLWLVGPRDRPDGRGAVAVVEQLRTPVARTRSLRGALNAITSIKSSESGKPMTPGEWLSPMPTNVIGQVALILRAQGRGRVWYGTQVDRRQPPPPTAEAMKTTGGCGWIRESDGLVFLPGNPALAVYTMDEGMTLWLWKIEGGRQYGAEGMVLPDGPTPME